MIRGGHCGTGSSEAKKCIPQVETARLESDAAVADVRAQAADAVAAAVARAIVAEQRCALAFFDIYCLCNTFARAALRRARRAGLLRLLRLQSRF